MANVIEQTLKFGAQVEGGLAQIKAVKTAILEAGVELEKLESVQAQVNEQGKLLSATFKGLTTTGAQFKGVVEAVVTETGKGKDKIKTLTDQLEITKLQFQQTTKEADKTADALDRQTKAAEKAAAAQAKLNAVASTAGKDVRATFPVPTDATFNQLQRYETAINNVQRTIASGAATQKEFAAALKNVGAGVPDGSKLGNQILDVKKAFELTNTEARGYLLTIKDITRIAEATAIKTVVGQFTKEMLEGIRTASQYQIAISEIRTISQENQLSFGEWSTQIRKVSDDLKLPIKDVAEANYQAISNQVVKGAESFDLLTKAGNLARVTQASLTQSINLLSTTFNAYNIPVSEAENVSAQFFKTIEVGKLRLSEISDTFGRAQFLARDLGVSLGELNAGLATITIQGVKAADAQTLLTNIFQKLLRPTTEMKEVFKQLGVTTGQEAIQTYTFAGVLQRLIDLSRSGKADVGDLFNEIRGRKGFEALANFEGEFKTTLDKIENGLSSYRKAIEIRAESPADFLNGELNKLKNVAINDFGQEFLSLAQGLVKGGQAIGLTAENSVKAIKLLVPAAATYAGASLIVNAANASMVLGFEGVSKAAITSSIVTKGSYLAIAASAVVLGNEIYRLRRGATEASDALEKFDQSRKDAALQASNASTTAAFGSTNATIGGNFGNIFQDLSRANIAIDSTFGKMQEKLKIIDASLKDSFKGYFDSLTQAVAKTNQEITKTEGNIKNAKNLQIEFKKAAEDLVFNQDKKFATPQQQLQMNAARIRQLEDEAKQLTFLPTSASGAIDAERAAENQKLINEKLHEALRLIADDENTRVDLAKQQAAAAGFSGKILVQSLKDNAALNDLKRLQANIQTSIVKQEERSLEILKKKKEEEKAREIKIKSAASDFEKFSPFDASGAVKGEFRDPLNKRLDQSKVNKSFDSIAQNLKDVIGSDGASQLNLINLIETKKFNLKREFELQDAKATSDALRRKLEGSKKATEEELKLAQDAASKSAALTFGAGGALDKLGGKGDLQTILKDFRGTNPTGGNLAGSIAGGLFGQMNGKQIDNLQNKQLEFDTASKQLSNLVEKAKVNAEDVSGVVVVRQKDIDDIKAASLRVIEATKAVILARDKGIADPSGAAIKKTSGEESAPFRDIESALKDQIKQLQDSRDQAAKSDITRQSALFNSQSLATDPVVKQLKDLFPQVADDLEKQAPKINNSLGSIRNSVKDIIDSVKNLKEELRTLDVEKAAPTKPIGASNFNAVDFGGADSSEYYATGGVVGLHPGRPRGTDTVPAWLTPGERVLTVAQNLAYEKMVTLIRPYMKDQAPRYYAGGGTVTNVGDITVTVQGASTDFAADDFARKVKRTIQRRGI